MIYDDRAVSAGVMFSDADLLGVPLRIIVSPRNLKENCCEIVSRDKMISVKIALDLAKEKIFELVQLVGSTAVKQEGNFNPAGHI